jgi:mannose-6-phosphate isomerase-like protein (cupin superfamily)
VPWRDEMHPLYTLLLGRGSVKREISKPWGKEINLHVNNKYIVKKLIINKGHRLSLQYHIFKEETLYLLKGKCKLTIIIPPSTPEDSKIDPIDMEPGMDFTILPGWIHRIEALEDSEILEASTIELWDVERIQDDYNRI